MKWEAGGPEDSKPSRRYDSDPLDDIDEAEELLADIEGELPGFDQSRAATPLASGPSSTPESLRAQAEAWGDSQAFESLSRVASAIAANLDFTSVVKQILDVAIETIAAKRGIIFLGNESDDEMVPIAARSIEGEDLRTLEKVSQTILRRSRQGEMILTADAFSDPSFLEIPSVQINELRSVLCMPMLARGKRVGVIYLDDPGRANMFPSHARKFLEAFAGTAAVAIENAQLHGEILRENRRLRRRLHSLDAFGRIITVSSHMTSALRRASMVAQVDGSVMILGESGTGKELLARSIHEASPRALNPFVAHNCAAVPRELMESIFFGHVKGAFTGANRDSLGLFRMADRGTLFLDEFAELDVDIQAKLLRVLEDGVVRPVGGQAETKIDFRLITATSRNITSAVQDGTFREDLFYRTNVLEVRLPPLRERVEDIPVLVDHFREKHTPDGAPGVSFSTSALEHMQTLPWRGNVRELQNLIQRVMVLCEGSEATADDIKRLMPRPLKLDSRRESDSEAPDNSNPTDGTALRPGHGADQTREPSLKLADQERGAILEALKRAGGNKSKAARILGLHRNSLLRRMERLEIVWEDA